MDEHATVIEVMVIHEVPVIEVIVIEISTGKSGATMEGATGETTQMATHATNMTNAHATHMARETAHVTAKSATSHMAPPTGEPATTASADRSESAVNSAVIGDANNVLEVRRARDCLS